MAKQQRSAAVEVLTTEIKYVNDLRTIVEVFLHPLRADLATGGAESGVRANEVELIFTNVESILAFNEELLKALNEALGPLLASMEDPTASNSPVEAATLASVGEIFEDMGPYLRVYTSYVNGHTRSSETHLEILKRQSKSNKYATFLANCAVGNEERVRGRSLLDFLIMPIQRIPRYRLLLEELLKRTSPDDYPEEDYHALELGLQRIADVANVINERLRDFENREKVADLQMRFGGESADLVEAHRVFVKEGYLKKITRRGPAEYYFVLFNDILVYGAPAGIGSVMAAVGGGGGDAEGSGGNANAPDTTSTFRLKRKFNLADISLSESSPSDPNQFEVKSPEKSFVVIAPDALVKNEWYEKIGACIASAKQAAASANGANPAGEGGDDEERAGESAYAPIWIPNSEAPACMICATKFTTFLRRHHCRNCGHVVCERCSPHRWYLPNIHKTKPQRMCSDCYLTIRADLEANGFENAENGPRPAAPGAPRGGLYDLFTIPIGTSITSLSSANNNSNSVATSGKKGVSSQEASPTEKSTSTTTTTREASSYVSKYERVGGSSSAAPVNGSSPPSSGAREVVAKEELPRNWVMLKNENGQVYYWNKITDLTQFEMPRKFGVLDRFPASSSSATTTTTTTPARTSNAAPPATTLASVPAKDRKSVAHKQLLAQTQASSSSPNRTSVKTPIATPIVSEGKKSVATPPRRASAHAGPSFSERLAALNAAGKFKDATVVAARGNTNNNASSSSSSSTTGKRDAKSKGSRKGVTFSSRDSKGEEEEGKSATVSPKSSGRTVLSAMHRELLAVGTRFLKSFSSSSGGKANSSFSSSNNKLKDKPSQGSSPPTVSVKKVIVATNNRRVGANSSSPAKEKRKASYVAATSVRELSKRFASPPNFADLDKEKEGGNAASDLRKKSAAATGSGGSNTVTRQWGTNTRPMSTSKGKI